MTAADPANPDEAKGLCSALCAFLAAPTGWDRCTPPVLEVLLTESAIESYVAAYVAARGTKYARRRRLTVLRTAVRGAGGRTAATPAARPGPTRDALRVHAACTGASVAVFAAVFLASTGKPVTDARLRGLCAELQRRNDANATAGRAGTFLRDSVALTEYLGAADVRTTEVVPASTNRMHKTTSPSRRSARAQEKANRDAFARAVAGPRLAPEPDLDALAPEVRSTLEAYRPQDVATDRWAGVRPLTIRLVAGRSPGSAAVARNAATIATKYLLWLWDRPGRTDEGAPTPVELLDTALVEAYISASARTGRSATVATERGVLRTCVRALDADHVDVSTPYAPVRGPYTPEECEQFAWLAQSQPGDRMRRNACFLIGLTLGAGLDSPDLRHLHIADIADVVDADGDRHLEVTVRRAGRTRVVPVRRQYERLVRGALSLATGEPRKALVLGRAEDRHNVTSHTRRQLVAATPGQFVEVNVARLRTTWLFACTNGDVPVAVLLRLAGLRSARTLTDLLPLCPEADAAVVTRLARAVVDATPLTTGSGAR